MEPKFNTSFIPKESLNVETSRRTYKKDKSPSGAYGIGFVVTMLVALGAIVATVGILFYAHAIKVGIAEKQELLEEQYAQLDTDVVQTLRAFNDRLRAAEHLAENHVAFSRFFTLLEQYTLRSGVRYTNMSFTVNEDEPRVSLSGEASALSNVALQMDAFRASGVFDTVELAGVQRGGDDNLSTFAVTLGFPKDQILFLAQGGLQGDGTPSETVNETNTEDTLLTLIPNATNTATSTAGEMEDVGSVATTSPATSTLETLPPVVQNATTTPSIDPPVPGATTPTENIPTPTTPLVPSAVVPGTAPNVPLIPLQ